jgi:hypothetical protein
VIWLRHRWLPLTVLVAATSLLVASIAWAAGSGSGWRSVMGPGTMTGPGAVVSGEGQVRSLDEAGQAAGRFADRSGLRVGEVMQFDNGFYAELVDPAGHLATEVLVDPRTGGVQVEWGPAMMWNTAYGMGGARGPDAGRVIGAARARAIADEWLAGNRPGEHAGDAELFPGYYTLHTLHGDQMAGMLSVNAATGAVWYHSWHGRFIAMTEHAVTD